MDNVFSVAPGDIFIHMWDKTSQTIGSYWNNYQPLTEDQFEKANVFPDIQSIHKIYKPKVLMVESEREIDMSIYNPKYYQDPKFKSSLGVKSVFYASRKVFELATQYGEYDMFFATRMDIKYTSKLNINELGRDCLTVPHNKHFVNDIWMFGPKKYLDIRTNYYHHIDDYWYNNPNYDNFMNVWQEIVMTKYLNDNNVPTQISDLCFEVPRIFGATTTFDHWEK